MTQKSINIGSSPNKGDGDPLRTAFGKINDNFDELYAADTATKYHLGDDVQFVDIDADSGMVVIQSGFDTGMPVYIKGANCADEGVGGNVIIEAGGAPLPNNGTTGNIELAAQQVTIESNNNMWTFRDDGVLELPEGGDIVDSNGDTVLGTGSWTFDTVTATTDGNIIVKAGGGEAAWASLLSNNGANSFWVDNVGAHVTSNFVEGEVTENYWTFGTDGVLTLPAGGDIDIPNGRANVTGTANTVGGGATVGVRSILAIDSAFGSNDANAPASAQAIRGRVTGSNLTKTRNYVAGVTGQYLVTGTNASEFINTGLLGVVGDQTTTANAAVVAYLDGDGGLTTASSAYGVSMKNSTPGSGFDYGLDLQFIDLNIAGTTAPFKQADIRFNNGAVQRDTATVTCAGNASTVVYTGSAEHQTTIKLLIQVEGNVGAAVDWDTQSCEMIIAKSWRADDVAATVYAVVHTSVAPLATFSAEWNALTSRVEVLCATPSANTVYVRTFATEITTAD